MQKNVFKPVDDEIIIEAITADKSKYKDTIAALIEFNGSDYHAVEIDWRNNYKSPVAAYNAVNTRLKEYGFRIRSLCYGDRVFLIKEDFYDEHYYG